MLFFPKAKVSLNCVSLAPFVSTMPLLYLGLVFLLACLVCLFTCPVCLFDLFTTLSVGRVLLWFTNCFALLYRCCGSLKVSSVFAVMTLTVCPMCS